MTASNERVVEALRNSLREREQLRKENRRLAARDKEPIAIVGMGCRFPGGVQSPEDLWRLVASGTDAISELPEDRGWDLERLYDPDPDARGSVYTRHGGFIEGPGEFDANFFGISPREALSMDPQQRLLLEVAWAAIESAGIDPASLEGTPAGVFAGAGATEYAGRAAGDFEGYRLTGTHLSVISGRIAYTLGLVGPAVTVDTACSSSLTAMHLACQALRRGETPLALAGGVTVMCTPWMLVEFSRQRGLATDGRCRSFADSADGTSMSEGAGLIVLERLSDARRHGHRVLAVIRGSAVNQDGASNGLSAPNGPSQERVIRDALASADLSPADVDAVEAHGTGTTLGDPIEAQALLATYCQERPDKPLRVGSLKSNIGHPQAAAGIAGVIKMVMALQAEELPKTLHLDEPSTHVDWSAGDLQLLTEPEPWPRGEQPRRAGVSSFGISGTNAHVILEEAPEAPEPAAVAAPEVPAPPALAWLVAAKSDAALRDQARRVREHVEERPELTPLDVAYSLATTRTQFDRRAAAVGSDRDALLAGLRALERGEQPVGAVSEGRTAFLFTGQGAQRAGMGRELAAAYPAFAQALDEVCDELDRHGERPLRELLFADEGSEDAALLDRTEYTQTALFAIEVALFRLVESLGIRPDALAGHSIGELSAAHVAGVLSLEDAAKLVSARGRLMGALPEGGAMLAVEATEEEIASTLSDHLSLAAVNGPNAVVVSGTEEAVEAAEKQWSERKTKRLQVSHAFHSHLMEPMLDDCRAVAESLTYNKPKIRIAAAGDVTDPGYWTRHVREPVRFAARIEELDDAGVTRFLELGPSGVLIAMAAAMVDGAVLVPALRAKHDDAEAFATFLATAHAGGVDIDWRAFFEGTGAQRVALPTYAFQRERFWLEARAGDEHGAGHPDLEGHPILTNMTVLGRGDEWLFTGRLSLQADEWIASHVLSGTVVLPGTAFVDLALRAGRAIGCDTIEELTLEAPLLPPDEGDVEIQVLVDAADDSARRQFTILSRLASGGEWTAHASGAIAESKTEEDALLDPAIAEEWPPAGAEEVDPESIVERLGEAAGFDYGPAFLGVRAAWRLGDAIFSEIELADDYIAESERYVLHPALLDMALHAGFARYTSDEDVAAGRGRMLFRWAGTRLHSPGAQRLRVRSAPAGPDAITVAAFGEDGRPVLSVEALASRSVEIEQLNASLRGERESLYRLEWPAIDAPDGDAEPPEGAVIRDMSDATVADALALLQEWLGEEREGESQLVLVTSGAVAAAEGEVPDPDLAAVWGLVRSAQSEHPGTFVLVDRDGDGDGDGEVPWGALLATGEPQIALRDGELRVPRLATMPQEDGEPPEWNPDGTVLITGGTGGLGALLARHLATEHDVRALLLASRRGPEAEGASELIAELAEAGCDAEAVACDVGDRDQLEKLVASIPAEHPLAAVIHAAGIVDDATIASLSQEQLERVLRTKAESAQHLYDLTEGLDLVVFSSAAAVVGSPGQGNYAAANAVLDALAHKGRAAGRAVTSIAWGPWERDSGMTGAIGAADVARIERMGIGALPPDAGLALFDAAVASGDPVLVPVRFDAATLRTRAREGALPAVMSGLAPSPPRRAGAGAGGGSLARRLAELPEDKWDAAVLELIRTQVAAVLGHASPDAVDPARSFKDLGFDSLSAVELRNRLIQTTGLRLPSTLVFDHPTVEAAARFVRSQVSDVERSERPKSRVTTRSDEPIAIVGMSCRFPGGVSSPDELWELVASGTNAISGFPEDRGWDLDRLYDPDPDQPGTCYTREGGFIRDATQFDAGFFGIGRSEALAMDPQQRLMLEAAWDAFQSAGIDPASLRETDTGVFAGAVVSDYRRSVGAEYEGFRLTGTTMSVLSGRLAHTFGLQGPAMTVDTACSSSAVALHLACQSLREGGCSLALAGGVTVMASPYLYVDFARQRGLAPDGRCKSYSADADGTGFSDGLGVLVLERLSDARRNGHRVLALVRGSAVNQDGASNGLTAPNGPSQERVIRQALANAGLSPADVDAVDGHGTGTTLGDPIEAQALLATYGQERADGPLRLGSIKSNIGHTSAAAGVAGVIKMVQAMRHDVLPQSLHCDEPSPHVDWSAGEVELLSEPVEWPARERPRRAAVSSFGISGTNVHVILEEAPAEDRAAAERAELPALPLVVTARTEAALRGQAERLRGWLAQREDLELDIAFSLATARAQLERRAVVVGADRGQLMEGLAALARDGVAPAPARGGKTVFVFPGQGAQWEGMALELIDSAPVFAESMRECGEALSRYVDWSLEDVLRGAEGAPSLERVDVVQPALFAVMVSLAALWRSYGVEPDAVVGHSQGEIAAAYVAGGLTLDDAARVVALRSQAVRDGLAGHGGMGSVALTPDAAEGLLERFGDRLSLAAVNGPASVVVSGEVEALEEFLATCEEDGVWSRRIPVDYPSHSARVEDLQERIESDLAGIEPRTGTVPFFSTVTAEVIDTAGLDGEYWYRSLRNRVRFNDAVEALIEDGAGAFLEMSPNPGLTVGIAAAAEQAGAAERVVAVGSLRRGEGGLDRFLTSLGEAYAHGVGVDWSVLFDGTGARVVDLPPYAFQRERYWLEGSTGAGDLAAAGLGALDHPLLSTGQLLAGTDEWLFTGSVSLAAHPWIGDHVVLDTVVVPATAFVEMALAAGAAAECETVEELTFEAPLVLGEHEAVQLHVRLDGPDDSGRRAIAIYSRAEGSGAGDGAAPEWTRHASGAVAPAAEQPERVARFAAEAWPPQGAEEVDADGVYDQLTQLGFSYGPSFMGIQAAWRRGDELFAEVALDADDSDDAERYGVHPALFDSAMHSVVALMAGGDDDGSGRMLFHWEGVRRYDGHGTTLRACLSLTGDDTWNVAALDEFGTPVVSAEAVVARPVEAGQLAALARRSRDDAGYALEWVELAAPSTNGHQPLFALLGGVEAGDLGESYDDLPALLEAIDGGAQAPDVVLAAVEAGGDGDADAAESVRAGVRRALALLQTWLADARLADTRLVLVTSTGMAARDGEVPDPAAAALWGLVRSAQSEHPGRFGLLDTDGTEASWEATPALLAGGEPQLALREGAASVPRVVRAEPETEEAGAALDPDGTVLITGGTNGLGALLARHLATEHHVGALLLASRRGPEAEGTEELIATLEESGCKAQAVACDVADRAQLGALLESIPDDRPLTAVIHAAGVIDDGVLEALTPEQVDRVMRPKVDGALHLHELTEELDLAQFLIFSSFAATLGAPGQANYSAANAFTDALAQRRHASGLAAKSLVWGAWSESGGMTSERDAAEKARIRRLGGALLTNADGLEMFDGALSAGDPVQLLVRLDPATMRVMARDGALPPVLSGLVRVRTERAGEPRDSLQRRLSGVPESDWPQVVLDLVCEQVASVLGLESAAAVDPQLAFKEMGFDSLAAVELRNSLTRATRLQLPATVVFDHPTPAGVAEHMVSQLPTGGGGGAAGNGAQQPIDGEFDRIEQLLRQVATDERGRAQVEARVRAFNARVQSFLMGTDTVDSADAEDEDLDAVSDEEMFALIDQEFGSA